MKGFVFSLDVLLAIALTLTFLTVVDLTYSPNMGLELHRTAEDSLAVLKIEGRLQTLDPVQIQEVLNKTTKHHNLEIQKYNKNNELESITTIGESIEENAAVSRNTFVDEDYFYKATLAVWQ